MKLAVFASILASAGNLMVSLSIVREEQLSGVGAFAIAMSVYALVTGVIRSAVTHTVIVGEAKAENITAGARRVSLIALVTAVPPAILGLALDFPYLAVLALTLHGLVFLDYSKNVAQAVGNPKIALWQELTWKVPASAGAVLGVIGVISPLAVFAVWAAAGAIVGYASALTQKMPVTPSWLKSDGDTGTSAVFGIDYLTGSGIAQITTWLVAATAGSAVVGGIRAAGTILGPINIVISAAESLVLRFLSLQGREKFSVALKLAFLLSAIVILLAAAVVCIPTNVGTYVFGENWNHAHPLLLPLSIELTFAVATSVAYAGLRSLKAASRSIKIRVFLMPLRLGLIIWWAVSFGPEGAVWAMALISALGTILYWWMFRRATDETGEK